VEGVLKLKLENVSFKLPKAQGGMSLSNVAGTLIFTRPDESRTDELKNGRIELMKNVTGQVAEAGGATVRLSGVYRGYRLDSPFSVRIEIDKMTLPMTRPTTQPTTQPEDRLHPGLKEILDRIDRDYHPVGTVKLAVGLSREAGQDDVSVAGTIWPLKISAAYRFVPYRLDLGPEEDEYAGEINFTNKQVIVKSIKG